MIIQLIQINIPYVFKRYVKKYNIYRDLFEIDLLALEIRDLNKDLAENARHIIFRNKEICYSCDRENSQKIDLLILGSFGIFKELAKDITASGDEDLGHKITNVLGNFELKRNHGINTKDKSLSFENPVLMGIVNVTPDSFSDAGEFFDKNKAVEHALKLVEDGAHIIDIGGESTRPNAEPVNEEEELKRVIPVIESLIKEKPELVISIDTTKSAVALRAIDAGASIINDISAMSFDKKMVEVAAKKKVPVILMHIKGTPKNMQKHPYYDDVILEIYDFLRERISFAEKNGVNKIIIDPGIGFGKRIEDNYEIVNRLNEFKGLSKPVMIGLSRKSFLGNSLNLPVEDRKEATLIAESTALCKGADIIRSHDIAQLKKSAQFMKNLKVEKFV